MSVREKDRQKNCPNRGLGIAAAAIGVGVGAALYYLFSKREETPHGEGSTSEWNERPQTLSEEDQMNVIRQQALAEEEYKISMRQQAYRERSWTLEECSICFDVMLRNQDVTSLACTHNFHTDCIMPWLQERQTCPNCRKAAE